MTLPKIINRPVKVWTDEAGRPLAFLFRRRRHPVACVLEVWEELDHWWEAPLERTVYRLETAAGGLYELEFRRPEGRWYLYKAYD
ncbi:MAG TPA: DUF6504 family protein [Sphingobacteriaceae bacterium]|nr:DUF6504 family protein [Sphingobacteriaceae bacterium]